MHFHVFPVTKIEIRNFTVILECGVVTFMQPILSSYPSWWFGGELTFMLNCVVDNQISLRGAGIPNPYKVTLLKCKEHFLNYWL